MQKAKKSRKKNKTILESLLKLIYIDIDKEETMKNQNKQKRITISINHETFNALEAIAKESGIQLISAVVRQAIFFYLSKNTTSNNFNKQETEVAQ